MAFPAVKGTSTYNGSTSASSHAVTLPASIASGDVLMIFFRNATGADPSELSADLSAYTVLFEVTGDASNDLQTAYAKVATGSEGATDTVVLGASDKLAALCYLLDGTTVDKTAGTHGLEVGTSHALGASTTPNPGLCTPTGGAKDYLWLWLGGWEGEQTSPPAGNPTDYTDPIGANTGTAGAVATNCRVASARREFNASSEDPGSWTISASDDWMACTIAVHPVVAAPADRDPFMNEARVYDPALARALLRHRGR